jgi:hypothetical protein
VLANLDPNLRAALASLRSVSDTEPLNVLESQ